MQTGIWGKNNSNKYLELTYNELQPVVIAGQKRIQNYMLMEEKRFLDVHELTEYIHMSESFVYKKVMKNAIPYIKLGTRTLFDKTQINTWVINGGTMKEDLPTLPRV